MSIGGELIKEFPDQISTVVVNKERKLHGEQAVEVEVNLQDGRTVTGTFTSHPRAGFGGVDFAGPKDVVGLMKAKIEAVLRGTYERST